MQMLCFKRISLIFQTGFRLRSLPASAHPVSPHQNAFSSAYSSAPTAHSIGVLCISSAASSVCTVHIYTKPLPLYPFLSHPLLKPAFIFKDSSTQPFMCGALNPFIPLSIPSYPFFPGEGGGSSLKSLFRERRLGPII